ncbi:hypothetical protein DFS33DRAFT_1061075 [Desarmillaria ectypa]|nr:hypothetical protein DFS33DRAFT_1061075 [Desarmillaria ectypa]
MLYIMIDHNFPLFTFTIVYLFILAIFSDTWMTSSLKRMVFHYFWQIFWTKILLAYSGQYRLLNLGL